MISRRTFGHGLLLLAGVELLPAMFPGAPRILRPLREESIRRFAVLGQTILAEHKSVITDPVKLLSSELRSKFETGTLSWNGILRYLESNTNSESTRWIAIDGWLVSDKEVAVSLLACEMNGADGAGHA